MSNIGCLILSTALVSGQNVPPLVLSDEQNVPLFVLNEVFFVDDDFTTPDFQQISKNFAEFETSLANNPGDGVSFTDIEVQLPVFLCLVVILAVLSVVYCRTMHHKVDIMVDPETSVYTLAAENSGFQSSKENLDTNNKQQHQQQHDLAPDNKQQQNLTNTNVVNKLQISLWQENEYVHVSKSVII